MLFLATHFKAGDNTESAEIRRQQANSLSKVIDDLKGLKNKFFDSAVLGPKLLLVMGCVKLGNQFAVCSPTEGR